MGAEEVWKCPKCGRSLSSGGESIAAALGPLARAIPDLARSTDIKCPCGAVISAEDLIDRKQRSEAVKHGPPVAKPSISAAKMQEIAKHVLPSQEPRSPSSKGVGQYRLQNGYTEFTFGTLAPNMPNPFTSAPAHCCACAQTIRADQVGEKVLFRGKKEVGPGLGQYLYYEAPGIICSRCSSQGDHVKDFMQVGVQKEGFFQELVLQVGNPEVAAIWHSHFDKFAAAMTHAMKESQSPVLRQLAGVRCGATSEKRLDPGSDTWVPPLKNDPSDSQGLLSRFLSLFGRKR